VFDLRDVLRRMGKLKGNALAMPARGEMPTLDDSHLMRHLGVYGIMHDRVDA